MILSDLFIFAIKYFTDSLFTSPGFSFYSIYSICCITKLHSYLLIFLHLLLNFIFQDYSVTYGHCPEITVYTSCCYFPSAAQLPSLWAENKKSLLSMLVEVSLTLLTRSKLPGNVQWKALSKHFLNLLSEFILFILNVYWKENVQFLLPE